MENFYPTVGIQNARVELVLNAGKKPFCFDIEAYAKSEEVLFKK